jgi:hypothetical protein
MNMRKFIVLCSLGLTAFTPVAGCQEKELSYPEAVAIYNAELETLQRLEAQRAALQQQLEPTTRDVIGGLLGEATKMAGQLRGELKGTLEDLDDPAGTADQLADPSAAEEAAGDLSVKIELEGSVTDEQRQEIQAQITKLDAEIAAQEARVERAKADRDAAEARR